MKTKSISLIAAGDICMQGIADQVDGAYARHILEQIQPTLNTADFRLVNLENPLLEGGTPIPKSGPNLKGLPGNVAFLEEGRFDCAVQANNHTGDFGEEGVLQTLALLDAHHIGHCGAGRNLTEAYQPWTAEKHGLRLAVVAAAENEFGGAEAEKAGMAGFEIGRMYHAIREAKQQADFVAVVFHGGNEFNPLPSPRMKERYRLFAEFGADAVIGMHPHCPQGYEVYRGVPIVYSVGNFFFYDHGQDPQNTWFYGYLPKLTFAPGEPARLEIFPYCFRGGHSPVVPFKGAEKERFMEYLQTISALFQDDRTHRDYFEGWCMIPGVSYANGLQYRSEYVENPSLWAETPALRGLRNLFTCEAHNEMITALFRLIEAGRAEQAKATAEKIRALQKMPV